VAIAQAAAESKSVIPWGGGTAQDHGYPPRRADVLLDLSGLDQILAHEPGDLTVTVEAGVTLAAVQQALAAHNQFLPLDPPHMDRATIGGILATNAFGPSRVGYGTARDWLIGLTLVDAQGRIIKGGGKVVKNVTGYDLPKLHVGTLGTLGVIVEATFKLAPLPETGGALLLRLSGMESDTVEGLLSTLRARSVSPALTTLHEEDGKRHLFLVWRGPQEVVVGEIEAVMRLARDAGLPTPQLLDPAAFSLAEPEAGDATYLRLAPLPADTWSVHHTIAATGIAALLTSCPFTGTIDVRCDTTEAAEDLLVWTAQGGIPVTVLQAPLALREQEGIALWQPLPNAFPLMQQLKTTLDPNGTLNPGRFLGRI